MIKRFSLIFLMAVVVAVSASAIDLKSVATGAYRPQVMANVDPLDDGESWAQISDDGLRIEKYSFRTGKKVGTMFDASAARGAKISRVDGYVIGPDGSNILIQTETRRIYRRSFAATYYIYNVRNNKLTPLSDGGQQQTPIFSPDGNCIAFVRQNNIFLVKLLYDNAESQVTKDGKFNEIINGVPDWVYEEEFSTNSSMVFTSDSRQICWIKYDESKVKECNLRLYKGVKPELTQYAEYPGAYSYKYPIAGETNSTVTAWSFDIQSRQTRQLQVPMDADGYMPRIVSTKDGANVAIFTMNRHQDCMRIYSVNPLSTVAKLLVEEKTAKYVNEETITKTIFTDKHILVPAESDGYMHLYLYSLTGTRQRQVCPDKVVIDDVYGIDEATGDIYFSSTMLGATDRQICVARANGTIARLSGKEGWNTAVFSKNFKYYINNWSDLNTPNVYTLCDSKGKTLATLLDNAALRQKAANDIKGERKLFTFTTSEGVTLNGMMILPKDFNPQKKYPVIMWQYGGPGSQEVRNAWNVGMCDAGAIFEHYLAEQGYISVCVDNRGTGGRGAEFEKCTYLRLGELESRDQVEAAIWLGNQSYVDKSRIGIWGWSYGGWNTLMSMSEGRAVFAAGVAVAPPTSWRYYDSVYSERYMRTPKENPSGYDTVNAISRASNLSGALLICHGLADDNVHFRNTAEYTAALVEADKDFRMLTYTNRNHSIVGGNTRNHLYRQIVNHFNDHLKK
ncbi:MAG: DPP IV N-terminal domain-containing protein [Prevotella sp.]|nr:DPP IV N-terminal domain-containing protein [Prevotella sp.]